MSTAATETQFLVEEVGLLQLGKIAIVGTNRGQPVKPGMRAVVTTAAGELSVEVISIGIVDPHPSNPDRKLLQVRIAGGDPKAIKSQTLNLK